MILDTWKLNTTKTFKTFTTLQEITLMHVCGRPLERRLSDVQIAIMQQSRNSPLTSYCFQTAALRDFLVHGHGLRWKEKFMVGLVCTLSLEYFGYFNLKTPPFQNHPRCCITDRVSAVTYRIFKRNAHAFSLNAIAYVRHRRHEMIF